MSIIYSPLDGKKHLFQESKVNPGFFWHIDLSDQTVSTKPLNKELLPEYLRVKRISSQEFLIIQGQADFSFRAWESNKPLVYFMECKGFVKIGKANHPEGRLEALQTGNPFEISILLTIDADEKQMHKMFASCHHSGEWFRREGALNNFLKSHGV